jgi:hypothetical protein
VWPSGARFASTRQAVPAPMVLAKPD